MSKRCYFIPCKIELDSSYSLIIPIKSTKINSAYGGMPQFFGGGSLKNETNLETVKRELKEEGLGYIKLKKIFVLKLIHTATLIKNYKKINFFFYLTYDFICKIRFFPFLTYSINKNSEMSKIIKYNLKCKKNAFLDMFKSSNIVPSNNFLKSETCQAFIQTFDILSNNNHSNKNN